VNIDLVVTYSSKDLLVQQIIRMVKALIETQ